MWPDKRIGSDIVNYNKQFESQTSQETNMLRYNLFKLGSISDSFHIILFPILIVFSFPTCITWLPCTLFFNYISLSFSESFACYAVIS